MGSAINILDYFALIDFPWKEEESTKALLNYIDSNGTAHLNVPTNDTNTLSGIHPKIDKVLEDTYGCIIYQEQVMKLVQVIFGMSLGEADMVRRAIGKKDPALMTQMVTEMKKRKRAIPITGKQVEHILDTISKCSSYLFNKSHSAAYAYTAYQTAFLKKFFPLQFYTALLNSNIDQEKTIEYLKEVSRVGIKTLFPEMGRSQTGWAIEDNSLRMGFSQIMGVGNAQFKSLIVSSREEFERFINENRSTNKRVLCNLAKAGCFKSISPQWAIDYIEWFKIADGRTRKINEKMELYKTNDKKVKEWEDKLKNIPEAPKYYETPVEVARGYQMEVLGMSNIDLFSKYDQSLCDRNPKMVMVMVDDVKIFTSKKGNPTVIITGKTKLGNAKFIASNSKVDTSKYDFAKKGDMIIVRAFFSQLDKGERVYFMNEIAPAQHL
jgi:DNA polymerase III alpha subunit